MNSRFRHQFPAFALILALLMGGSMRGGVVPVSTTPPADLQPANTPQIIVITFDDAVNEDVYQKVTQFTSHHNPDGSPVAFTFFVSTDWTDYYRAHLLHAAGHEMAVHTMTHRWGGTHDIDTWVREIEGCREALHRFAGIPLEDIRGFRAPFLEYNPALYEALENLGFGYDSSVIEETGGLSPNTANFIWPYTLHEGIRQTNHTGVPPGKSHPLVMQIPLWGAISSGGQFTGNPMDPAASLAAWQEGFLARYEGNRAPWGLWLHLSNWGNAGSIAVLNEFLDWALAKPDVWVVTMSGLEAWMRDPVPAGQIADRGLFHRERYDPVPAADTSLTSFEKGSVRVVGEPPMAYPAPDSIFLRALPVSAGVFIEVNFTSVWTNGFQGELTVRNANDFPLSSWRLHWDSGGSRVTWGDGFWDSTAEGIRISPGWIDPVIPPGGERILRFGGQGTPESFGRPSGEFRQAGYRIPPVKLEPTTGGDLLLQWERGAAVYELQQNRDLTAEGWETIATLYGTRSQVIPRPEGPGRMFYRLLLSL